MKRVDDLYDENLAHQRRECDRRFEDVDGLLGERERRKRAERRLPIMDEVSVSFSDWIRYMVQFQAKLRRQNKVESTARRDKPTKR